LNEKKKAGKTIKQMIALGL